MISEEMKKIVIIGASGAGKSTLCNVLSGLYTRKILLLSPVLHPACTRAAAGRRLVPCESGHGGRHLPHHHTTGESMRISFILSLDLTTALQLQMDKRQQS